MFVDRICINQIDPRMKAEGIMNIGAVLNVSNSLLVASWRVGALELQLLLPPTFQGANTQQSVLPFFESSAFGPRRFSTNPTLRGSGVSMSWQHS